MAKGHLQGRAHQPCRMQRYERQNANSVTAHSVPSTSYRNRSTGVYVPHRNATATRAAMPKYTARLSFLIATVLLGGSWRLVEGL